MTMLVSMKFFVSTEIEPKWKERMESGSGSRGACPHYRHLHAFHQPSLPDDNRGGGGNASHMLFQPEKLVIKFVWPNTCNQNTFCILFHGVSKAWMV